MLLKISNKNILNHLGNVDLSFSGILLDMRYIPNDWNDSQMSFNTQGFVSEEDSLEVILDKYRHKVNDSQCISKFEGLKKILLIE